MSTPDERTKGLRFGHEMLGEIDLDHMLPDDIRSRAANLLMAYPSPEEVHALVAARSQPMPMAWPRVFLEARGLFREIQRREHGSEVTRRSVMGTLRHFPEEWILKDLLDSDDVPSSFWFAPEALRQTQDRGE